MSQAYPRVGHLVHFDATAFSDGTLLANPMVGLRPASHRCFAGCMHLKLKRVLPLLHLYLLGDGTIVIKNFFSRTVASACLCVPIFTSGVTIASDEHTAKELTILLKSSRAVLVQNKTLITDPQGAGITADKFLELALAKYE